MRVLPADPVAESGVPFPVVPLPGIPTTLPPESGDPVARFPVSRMTDTMPPLATVLIIEPWSTRAALLSGHRSRTATRTATGTTTRRSSAGGRRGQECSKRNHDSKEQILWTLSDPHRHPFNIRAGTSPDEEVSGRPADPSRHLYRYPPTNPTTFLEDVYPHQHPARTIGERRTFSPHRRIRSYKQTGPVTGNYPRRLQVALELAASSRRNGRSVGQAGVAFEVGRHVRRILQR
jgi:hypothetical protein